MSNPQKRVWFITGTTSGLGNALMHELLETGHSVIATSRKPEPVQAELNETYDEETLKRALVVKLDITKVEEVKIVFAKAIDKFGRIDVVVNNAGYGILGELEVIPLETAREQLEVLFWGPVSICKEAIRVFREVNPRGEGGHIFNISGVGGYCAQPTLAYFMAAKFGLEGYTESLRKEMSQEWNIQATIIEPGGHNTEWRKNLTVLPIHPAYDTDSSPTKRHRSMLDGTTTSDSGTSLVLSTGTKGSSIIGCPKKAAKAFITLAERRQDLPLRIQFGSDAVAIVQHTAMKTVLESQKWESLSHSTNVDGINSKEYTRNLLTTLG